MTISRKSLLTLLAFIFCISGCTEKTLPNLDSWIGNYCYEEEPVKALSDYEMVIEWQLSIEKDKENYQGVLEINGQQTFVKYLVNIKGEPDSVKFIFLKQLDGIVYPDKTLKEGELLLCLKRDKNKLITEWGKLTPMLSEKWPQTCTCFIRK